HVLGAAQRRDDARVNAVALQLLHVVIVNVEADAVLLDGGDDLLVGNLVALQVFEVVLTDGAAALADVARRLTIRDEVRQDLVLHLDGADGVLRGGLIDGSDAYYLVTRPEDFCAGLLDDLHGLDARHLLGGGGVNAGDPRMRVRAAQDGAGEQTLQVVVVGVLSAARRLDGAIDTGDALAEQRTFCGVGPGIFAHECLIAVNGELGCPYWNRSRIGRQRSAS